MSRQELAFTVAAVAGMASALMASACAWALLNPTVLSTVLAMVPGDRSLLDHVVRFIAAATGSLFSFL